MHLWWIPDTKEPQDTWEIKKVAATIMQLIDSLFSLQNDGKLWGNVWHLHTAPEDVFKCLVLWDQQNKTQTYLIYCDIQERKAANAPTGEVGAHER